MAGRSGAAGAASGGAQGLPRPRPGLRLGGLDPNSRPGQAAAAVDSSTGGNFRERRKSRLAAAEGACARADAEA